MIEYARLTRRSQIGAAEVLLRTGLDAAADRSDAESQIHVYSPERNEIEVWCEVCKQTFGGDVEGDTVQDLRSRVKKHRCTDAG